MNPLIMLPAEARRTCKSAVAIFSMHIDRNSSSSIPYACTHQELPTEQTEATIALD